ncbi:hypothetical protein N7488_006332 [Penicillium malachiteum]|nr:hypothetical protein N7488_006332 [Penicillium malachiteum]
MAEHESLLGDEPRSEIIQMTPSKDTALRDLQKDAQGWYAFVNENWRPSSREVEDQIQRRHLMERWATADQEFRDEHHQQAQYKGGRLKYPASPLTKERLSRFVCIAPLQHAHNRRNLVKILICCYFTGGFGGKHVLRGAVASVPHPQIPHIMAPKAKSTDTIIAHHVLPSALLNMGEFRAISMTKNGFAFFTGRLGIWFIIDQTDLETGRMTMASFNADGTVRDHIKLLPWNMAASVIRLVGLGWSLRRVIFEDTGGSPHLNEPIDMDLPLLDLVETAQKKGKFLMDPGYTREQWAEEIERNAPGYLELEAEGHEAAFDLHQLQPFDG